MKAARVLILSGLVLLCVALLLSGGPVQAQGQSWLTVWMVGRTDEYPAAVLEYRDAAGNVVASYPVSDLGWPRQAAGRVYGSMGRDISVFDPYTGQMTYYQPFGLPPDTDTEFYNLSYTVPAPDGSIVAYSVTLQHNNPDLRGTSWLYLAVPGEANATLLVQQDMDPWMALYPMGWSDDGSVLLVHDQPQGIGGYILYWQYQNVQRFDFTTGAVEPVGNVDGYSGDALLFAQIAHDQLSYAPTGLTVTNLSTGIASTYPLPILDEQPALGGDAVFSPDNTLVAWQVARGDPEHEKRWTLVTDLVMGETWVVLQDESVNYETRYGGIGGWLDNATLVVGDEWSQQSALVDALSGTLLGEAPGGFLGYAVGIDSAAGFAPSGVITTFCPGAPPSRLVPGQRGRVTFTDGSPVNVRQWPDREADKTGTEPEGMTFTVLSGPTCAGGYAWWNVRFDDGVTGYVAEGEPGSYYLEPWQ